MKEISKSGVFLGITFGGILLSGRALLGDDDVLLIKSLDTNKNEERVEGDEGVEEDEKNEVEVIDYRCSNVLNNMT
ncbi:hypothetical protein DFA_03530 [Cavenderia fasciculata]|uniref:Uncharacterized protein n=1 Tax=Cavenderia fasciculata TaxID=261658 RepID=F4PHU8_CACFS|nr:uncharacterized protein DFA_03530 [Cavenderia fasciculata]EGG25282.1 hypothetical protein DFA_03530 [Cavenderia fasciculata]|eukprot:XP_004363133.1 hypothetical protein DFA_03530 [Cavenderia fasciculata]